MKTFPDWARRRLGFLRGGWPDQARLVIQRPVFARLLKGFEPRGACLNAGCGEGLFLPFLDRLSGLSRIVHMDLQEPALNHLRYGSRHETAAGSLAALPFRDNEFDFVFCTEVLEHINDDATALREVARVLRPGGLALFSTPTPPAPAVPAHVREGYTFEELQQKFARAGIELPRHAYCFHGLMRLLLKTWRWQFQLTGERKSWMPRGLVQALGYGDRWFPVGQPFDLVVLGRKL